jgi:Leucine-rich repeat (LRR) protein
MPRLLLLALLFCLSLPNLAQDNGPYELALQRIHEAEASGATDLDLTSLGLTEVPPEIANLGNLQQLRLGENQLTEVPREIFSLTNLERLSAEDNLLTTLAPEIGNLIKLVSLTLNDNDLTSLPPEIGNLKLLYMLKLRDNQLTSLPPEIGNLTNLMVLDLSSNKLQSLPPEIGNLTNLCLLWLNSNELETLPTSMGNLQTLAKATDCIGYSESDLFSIHSNPLVFPPEEIIREGKAAIIDYLASQALENPASADWQPWAITAVAFLIIVLAFCVGSRWYRGRGKKKLG